MSSVIVSIVLLIIPLMSIKSFFHIRQVKLRNFERRKKLIATGNLVVTFQRFDIHFEDYEIRKMDIKKFFNDMGNYGK